MVIYYFSFLFLKGLDIGTALDTILTYFYSFPLIHAAFMIKINTPRRIFRSEYYSIFIISSPWTIIFRIFALYILFRQIFIHFSLILSGSILQIFYYFRNKYVYLRGIRIT